MSLAKKKSREVFLDHINKVNGVDFDPGLPTGSTQGPYSQYFIVFAADKWAY
jgi:hypothetical protein